VALVSTFAGQAIDKFSVVFKVFEGSGTTVVVMDSSKAEIAKVMDAVAEPWE